MDQYGFFIYWKSEGREGDVKELSQVNDIRNGELPKVCKTSNDIWSSADLIFVSQDPRLQTTLKQRHGENFHERSLIVCSGLDMVNITCTNIIFKDVSTAQVNLLPLISTQ